MTYDQALQAFRNLVNLKFPLDVGGKNRSRRHINGLYGRGRGARGGRGGRGRGREGQKRPRADAITITLTDGRELEYHASYNFPPHVYRLMKQSDKDLLRTQRDEYKQSRHQQRQVNFVGTQTNNNATPSALLPSQSITTSNQVNQVTSASSTVMGGRNEQATQRNNPN